MTSNIVAANSAIASVTTNLSNFETYANAHFVTGTYSNANVASYLLANPQGGVYANANVASYLPTYTGNINGNVPMLSTVARFTWVSNVAPTSGQGSVGDIWYQTF
jgi:hypothetical protein